MKTRAYLGLAVGLLLAACGGGSEGSDTDTDNVTGGDRIPIGSCVDVTGDGLCDCTALDVSGDGIAESCDNDGDGDSDRPLPSGAKVVADPGGGGGGTGSGTSGGSGNPSTGDVPISGTEEDGGAQGGGGSGPVVVETTVKMYCGDEEIELDTDSGYVCCEAVKNKAWSEPTVTAANDCAMFNAQGDESVASECDSKSECGSAYCCFTYATMSGPPMMFVPRVYGRKCLTENACNNSMAEGAGSAFSCNDASDCPKMFKKCEPEGAGKTNANTAGRPWAKICKP